MAILACPVCGNPLTRSENTYLCGNRHSFDISKQGYVNLILPNKKNSPISGDNRQSVRARESFLSNGYYKPLADRLNLLAGELPRVENVLDLGCGVGYYAGELKKHLPGAELFGLDVSKEAVRLAAARHKDISFIVGNAFRLPFADGSFDLIINIFAPADPDELKRTLAAGGAVFAVRPGENHLAELRKLLYDAPRSHEDKLDLPGLSLTAKERVSCQITVPPEDLQALYKMTPYFWNAPPPDTAAAEITVDFIIYVHTNITIV